MFDVLQAWYVYNRRDSFWTSIKISYDCFQVNGTLLSEEEWFKLEILSLAYESSVLKVMEGQLEWR